MSLQNFLVLLENTSLHMKKYRIIQKSARYRIRLQSDTAAGNSVIQQQVLKGGSS